MKKTGYVRITICVEETERMVDLPILSDTHAFKEDVTDALNKAVRAVARSLDLLDGDE